MDRLCDEIMKYDEDYPGEVEAMVVVPANVWAKWLEIAGVESQYDLFGQDE